jgi:Protein of unknown function (DUF3383)
MNGAVTGLGTTIGNQGTGYSLATGLTTSGGSGTGLEVDITAIGETPLQAIEACRIAQPQWYAVMSTTAVKADHEAISAWAQSATPQVVYFFNTSDADVPNGTTGNILQYLSNLSYNRAFGLYSTTQGGTYPNNAYASARAMGVAMGLNTGLANSYFTMKFKRMVGVAPEPLSETQWGNIKQFFGNILASFANAAFSWLQEGTVMNGQFFDEILFLDMIAAQSQYAVVNTMISNNVVPQDEVGQMQLIHAIERVLNTFVAIGFLNPGATWNGPSINSATPGTVLFANGAPMPQGFAVVSDSYANQSPSDRDARKAMPIYILIAEAGAIHDVTAAITVQR